MSTFISVDYDFLVPHGMFEASITLGNGDKMPGDLVFDWQMREGREPMLDHVIWETRVRNFNMWGLDIVEMTKPKLDAADFIAQMSARTGAPHVPTWYADSHTWATILTRDLSEQFGPLNVVNFDAHHDLGYDGAEMLDVKDDHIDCGNWVLAGLTRGWIANYTIVYPDWQGELEFHTTRRKAIKSHFGKLVNITTWSEFLAGDEIEDVEAAFFCRSSAWTPPWLDAGFQTLLDEWGYSDCLDCSHGQMCSPYDACALREWDWDEVARMQRELEDGFRFLQGSIAIESE